MIHHFRRFFFCITVKLLGISTRKLCLKFYLCQIIGMTRMFSKKVCPSRKEKKERKVQKRVWTIDHKARQYVCCCNSSVNNLDHQVLFWVVMGQTMFKIRCSIVWCQKEGVRVHLPKDEHIWVRSMFESVNLSSEALLGSIVRSQK